MGAIAGFDDFINAINWEEIIIQARVEHIRSHAQKPLDICGECIKAVLLRMDE